MPAFSLAAGKKSQGQVEKNMNAPMNNAAKPAMVGGMIAEGSKAMVYHGTAHHTAGGLTRKDLIKNKRGKIVSRKQAAAGKKAYTRLVKAGYKPTKGKFKLFTKKTRKAAKKGGKRSFF
jgi:hypothetical protein